MNREHELIKRMESRIQFTKPDLTFLWLKIVIGFVLGFVMVYMAPAAKWWFFGIDYLYQTATFILVLMVVVYLTLIKRRK